MNQKRDMSNNFSENCKPGFIPPPYKKQNNNFPSNKNFNKLGTKPYIPAPSVYKPVAAEGANATPNIYQMLEV